jgi:hypothetical protein
MIAQAPIDSLFKVRVMASLSIPAPSPRFWNFRSTARRPITTTGTGPGMFFRRRADGISVQTAEPAERQ